MGALEIFDRCPLDFRWVSWRYLMGVLEIFFSMSCRYLMSVLEIFELFP